MQCSNLLTFAILAVGVRGVNIVLGNDDGWAVANIRAMYDTLTAAGHSVILSSPADNKSGSGPLDLPAVPVLFGCQFDSCPALSAAHGHDAENPRLNYVNSFPVTAMKYGLDTLAPQYFNGTTDLVVTGPNVGGNSGSFGLDGWTSGTLSAAAAGARKGISAIAFSSLTGEKVSFKMRPTGFSETYASLATALVERVLQNGGAPKLPAGTFVSVNYAKLDKGGDCSTPKYVLARATPVIPIVSGKDFETCGNGGRLPQETDVLEASGCFASVAVLDMNLRLDASPEAQAAVAQALGDLVTCLPA